MKGQKGISLLRFVMMSVVLLAAIPLSAQTIKVKGQVVDTAGEPMIGVSVMLEKNSTSGTITDFDGNFQLDAENGSNLKFSYIGWKGTAGRYRLLSDAF